MFIIGLLSSLVLINYRSNQNKHALSQSTQKLVSDIKKAQNMALSGTDIVGNYYGYGVYLVDNATSYLIYGDINNNSSYQVGDTIIETINLNEKIRIKETAPLSTEIDIFFRPPNPITYIDGSNLAGKNATVTLEIIDTSNTKIVTISTAGVVQVGSLPSIPNIPPVADIDADPLSGDVPLEVDFDASGSYDLDGEIVSYEWDFGDGDDDTGETTNHTYDEAGDYLVTLVVTDDNSDTDNDTVSISVSESNYFGDGLDGDVTISANTSLEVQNKDGSYDGDMVVMNYNNLTIDAGVTLTTDQPGRGLLIYVRENATINGTLSMTAKGGYSDPTTGKGAGNSPSDDSAVSVTGLRYPAFVSGETDTLSSADFAGTGNASVAAVSSQPGISGDGKIFTVQREGAAGGNGGDAPNPPTEQYGQTGYNGSAGQSGGGAGGNARTNPPAGAASGGDGTAGTCFSGGSGGGGAARDSGGGTVSAGSSSVYGGRGGNGAGFNCSYQGCGGVGNPGGSNGGCSGSAPSGTGGLLILIVGGDLSGTGNIHAKGTAGAYVNWNWVMGAGGGSGGGNIIILYGGTNSQSWDISADGVANSGTSQRGGHGSVQGPTQINP